MEILITAGSTQMPIDKVRIMSNIFKGTTGTYIANQAFQDHHRVTLVANHSAHQILKQFGPTDIVVRTYKTFDELEALMEDEITNHHYDVIIHSAAVSDYRLEAVFDNIDDLVKWNSERNIPNGLGAGKIPSGQHLYMAFGPTVKLVDRIRSDWRFSGTLVKFKLQVDMSDEKLLDIAKNSMKHSGANYIVANCLENFQNWGTSKMFIIDSEDKITECTRDGLATKLLGMITK